MHIHPFPLIHWQLPRRRLAGLPPIACCAAQCTLAALCLAGIALSLDAWLHTTVVAALGATTFIVFATPHAPAAHGRALIGGYAMGIVAGACCTGLERLLAPSGGADTRLAIVAGAASVGLCAYLMLRTRTAHPPAAGVALHLALSQWDAHTLLFLVSAVVLLALARRVLAGCLRDVA